MNKYTRVFVFGLLAITLCGCATVPLRETIPTYYINGTQYFALTFLCESRGIILDYDSITKIIRLSKDAHTINLWVGDSLALVDGKAVVLDDPVDVYQGALVVPKKFKQNTIDALFALPYKEKLAWPVSRIRKIVIDPGHGGRDPGAIGRTGLREKDLTLDVARRLARLLESKGLQIVMTRTADTFVSLGRRVEIANNSQADLFLSIHGNANRARSLKGFEIYYVSPSVDDSQRAMQAAKYAVLDIEKSCFAANSQDLKATLWDLILTNSRAESIELARSICRNAQNDLNVRILGVKDARYYVLKGVRTPAVLIEMGFLSNSEEEQELKSSSYRQRIAECTLEGIRRYINDFRLTEAVKR